MMFLHLGGDNSVRLQDIVSMHAYSEMCDSKDGKKFLAKNQDAVKDLSGGRPISAVVTTNGIYLSKLSVDTLKRRSSVFSIF